MAAKRKIRFDSASKLTYSNVEQELRYLASQVPDAGQALAVATTDTVEVIARMPDAKEGMRMLGRDGTGWAMMERIGGRWYKFAVTAI